MDNIMRYKGYWAEVRYSDEDECFWGKIEGLKNTSITFEGNTVKELNKCFNGMGEVQQYVAPIVTIESLKNLLESCYNIEAPKLENDSQRKITFVYGTNDIARLCLPRIKKYKNSEFIKIDSLGHCGYFREKTDEYIKKLIR